jgi:hypothetical protein
LAATDITLEGDLTDDERAAAEEAAATAVARLRDIEARKHCPGCEAEILRRPEQVGPGPEREVLLETDATLPAHSPGAAYLVPVDAEGAVDRTLPVVPLGGDVAVYRVHACSAPPG